MIRPLACLLCLATTAPLAAQDLTGLREMENACLLDTGNSRFGTKLCEAFRYGIAYRDRQISAPVLPALRPRLPDTPGTLQHLGKTSPDPTNSVGAPAMMMPPHSLEPKPFGQIVR